MLFLSGSTMRQSCFWKSDKFYFQKQDPEAKKGHLILLFVILFDLHSLFPPEKFIGLESLSFKGAMVFFSHHDIGDSKAGKGQTCKTKEKKYVLTYYNQNMGWN